MSPAVAPEPASRAPEPAATDGSDQFATDGVVTLAGWPAVAEGDLGQLPTATSIRRFTRDAARTRAGATLGSLLSDVYYAVVVAAAGVGLALGVAQQLRAAMPPAPTAPGIGLDLAVVVLVAVIALVAALASLAGRLGPVGAGGAEAAWWLGLPVDRRGLLRPAARRLPVVAALLGAVVVAVLDAGLLADSGDRLVRAAVAGALGGALVVLVVGLVQSLGVPRRVTALVADLLVIAAPVAVALLVEAGLRVSALPVLSWPELAGPVLLVVAAAALLDRRLPAIRERSLRESGSVATQAAGAVASLDSRELGRALSDGSTRSSRRRSSRLRTVRGPASALVSADLVLLRRSTRHLIQLVLVAAVPALVTVVPQLQSEAGVLIAVLICGALATSASAEGARRAEMAPILDRLLPLEPTAVRRLRMVVPAVVMLLWCLAVFAALGRWAGDLPGWLALGVAGVPAWAASAVRGAYRAAPDWGKPLVSTPFGALPTGVASVIARGPDVIVLGLLPTWIALVLRSVSPTLLVVQAVASLIAFSVASSTQKKSFMQRALDAQEADRKSRGAR